MANLGVPIKLLHEALGHVVTCELKTGQLYRGTLLEAEDSCNISLREITVTARDGRVSQLEQVYIRGSMVRYFIVPDMLANAPMFKRVGPNAMRGRGIGTVVEQQSNVPTLEEETAGPKAKVSVDRHRAFSPLQRGNGKTL